MIFRKELFRPRITTRRIAESCAVAGLLLAITSAPAQNTSTLTAEFVTDGFEAPLFVGSPPGDPRLFVVEQGGIIRIVKDGRVLSTPFIDVSDRIINSGTTGLLGLAFHPDFANNRYFYLNFINLFGNTVIARFTVSDSNPDIADINSEFDIITIPQPTVQHNGGMISFGPDDRFLYIGMGDGGPQGDPNNRAQTLTNELLGKMLRIDVDTDDFPQDPERNYGIPATNPFVEIDGDDEIWAYGLRNPWRWSFDRSTADLWIADVGWNEREELDFQSADRVGGENYGWRCMEGTRCTGLSGCVCNDNSLTLPIYDYTHNPQCAITGGYVYRGDSIPLLRGTYFFADYCSAEIWSLRYDGLNISEFQDRTNELDPGHGLDIRLINSFGEDADGNLYLVDQIDGEIYRIATQMQIVTTKMIAGQTATFRIRGATPETSVYFVYSLVGLGDVTVPQLNIRLGIANPRLIGRQKTNDLGSAVLKRTIPSNTAGQTIWLQGAENGNTSNVLRRTIQ